MRGPSGPGGWKDGREGISCNPACSSGSHCCKLPSVPSLIAVSTARGADNRSCCRMIGLALRSGIRMRARSMSVRLQRFATTASTSATTRCFAPAADSTRATRSCIRRSMDRLCLLHWLQCVEQTCPDRVPLFARLESDAPAGEAEAARVAVGRADVRRRAIRIRPIRVDPALSAAASNACGKPLTGSSTTRNQLHAIRRALFGFASIRGCERIQPFSSSPLPRSSLEGRPNARSSRLSLC